MSTRHTKGPWGWTYDGSSGYSIGEADDPQDKRVATVSDRNDERAMANCNLIAAAPDLLEACCLAVQYIAEMQPYPDDRNEEMWKQLRATIAKATGATP